MFQNLARFLVLVPSWNDSAALTSLFAQIAALGDQYQGLLLDDGSDPPLPRPDSPRHLFAMTPANVGLGECTKIAATHALRHSYAALVRVDADGQHSITDIPRMLEPIIAGSADLVVGVRSNRNADGSLIRRMARGYYSILAGLLTNGATPSDVTTGLFAAGQRAIAMISRETFGRFPEPEVIVAACRSGLRVVTVEVEQNLRTEGSSTLDVTAALLMLFRFHVFALGELLRGKRR